MSIYWKFFSLILGGLLGGFAVILDAAVFADEAPRLGCWFLGDAEMFTDEGADAFLTSIAETGSFNLLSTSTRYDVEVTDPKIHDFFKRAAENAQSKGLGLLLDLDIRMARRAFEAEFPNRYQQKLIFAETPIIPDAPTVLSLQAETLTDHYTGNSIPYLVRSSRPVGAWSYEKTESGEIVPESIQDVTDKIQADPKTPNQITITLEGESPTRFLSVAGTFDYLYPDLFSPELIPFEKRILRQYADVPLAGACKDEWGFPPCFNVESAQNEFWFSPTMADAYQARFSGRNLLLDLFGVFRPRQGAASEPAETLDRYNRLCFDRHVEIETEYAQTLHEVFGPDAMAATHPSWWPWPDAHEFKKNTLSWWAVPRDWAQTDECVPFACRSSLAKRTGRFWTNMFYAHLPAPYADDHWGGVLAGGRVNIHPLYPPQQDAPQGGYRILPILDSGILEARRAIRLHDFISTAPVDSPAAVVFGHFGAMNFARPIYNRVATAGVGLCDSIMAAGYPVDFTPSSEAASGRWSVIDGCAAYGEQPYRVVVLFGESDSDRNDFDWLRTNIFDHAPKTTVLSVSADADTDTLNAAAKEVAALLHKENIEPVTPAVTVTQWGRTLMQPPRSGYGRLLDGTRLWTAASDSVAGDRMCIANETFGAKTVSFTATGLCACRFDADGELIALAAAKLESFTAGDFHVAFETPTDFAIQRAADGTWSGVIGNERKPLDDTAVRERIGLATNH